MQEVWKQVPEFPEYEVSDMGRVRSYRSNHGPRSEPRLLKQTTGSNGYKLVILYSDAGSKLETVHRLVLLTFAGPCPDGCLARHVHDPCRTNNALSNLAWGTHLENEADKKVHGTGRYACGAENGASKLVENDVVAVRDKYASGKYTQDELARAYGISQRAVGKIVQGKTWPNCAGPITPYSAIVHEYKTRAYESVTRGAAHKCSKLTDARVYEMRTLRNAGSTLQSLATRFGVSKSMVSRIVRGLQWAHVGGIPCR